MQIYEIYGIETFTSKKGIKYIKLHCVYLKEGIAGFAVENFIIEASLVPSELSLNDTVNVFYGRNGSNGFLAGIQIVNNN